MDRSLPAVRAEVRQGLGRSDCGVGAGRRFVARLASSYGYCGWRPPPHNGLGRLALPRRIDPEVQRILYLHAGPLGQPAWAVYVSFMDPGNTPAEPKPHLLVIDDDAELCAMLVEYLTPEGFVTSTALSGTEGLEVLGRVPVDLVILDVMLPQRSGFEVLRRIRAVSRVPVIMLTARGEEVDRVVGLELGADDYLAKPFSPRELVARIRAVLRRVPGEAAGHSGVILWGPLRLDLRAHRAHAGEQDLELTSAELRILELLVRADTRTVTRDELMAQALGRRLLPTDRSLDTHVSNLRRKIARFTDLVSVQSVRGAGYALTLPAARPASAAPAD